LRKYVENTCSFLSKTFQNFPKSEKFRGGKFIAGGCVHVPAMNVHAAAKGGDVELAGCKQKM